MIAMPNARPVPGDAGQEGPIPGGPRALLGERGRALKPLFPAPAPRPRRSGWPAIVVMISNLAALGIGACVLLIRQAGTPSWQTLWAEDRWVFLPRALVHPWSSIFRAQAGYLQLVPQLIADVVARFPMRFAAASFAIAGALVASGCAIFRVLRQCWSHTPAGAASTARVLGAAAADGGHRDRQQRRRRPVVSHVRAVLGAAMAASVPPWQGRSRGTRLPGDGLEHPQPAVPAAGGGAPGGTAGAQGTRRDVRVAGRDRFPDSRDP